MSPCVISLIVFVGMMQIQKVAHAAIALDFSLNAPERRLAGVPHAGAMRNSKNSSGSLSFAPPKASRILVTDHATWTKPFSFFPRSIFKGGAQSLVARTVGHAEGTRTVTGAMTWAYWGHVDPGNQVWNRGTFSYQHSASSPEDADVKQLKRLKRQAKELERQAKAKGIKLSLLEKLNGIDLANQAPLAALDRGYIHWLAEAKQIDLPEEEAILWARTWAYWDPDLNTWNAPGLGNTRRSIEADQRRRQWAIAQVLHQCPRDYPTDCPAR